MTFKINNVDITPYILHDEGIQYTRNDIDGPNAGRALDGTMYRDRVTVKDKWTITCMELSAADCAKILSLIYPEYVTVTATDPRTGQDRTFQAYSNNVPATHACQRYENGQWVDYWSGISFPLIER